jgi:hypothetical protein
MNYLTFQRKAFIFVKNSFVDYDTLCVLVRIYQFVDLKYAENCLLIDYSGANWFFVNFGDLNQLLLHHFIFYSRLKEPVSDTLMHIEEPRHY